MPEAITLARFLESEKDLHEGMAHLKKACPVMAELTQKVKLPPLRRSKGGFAGLVRIVLSQQLAVAAADTIERRLFEKLKEMTPRRVLSARETSFRACGVSGPKIRTLKALAKAVETGELDFTFLETATPEAARDMLTKVSGIGPWTSDIYVMFCLGHADGFAPGDLALQEAAKLAHGWRKRPDVQKFEKHARKWSPWRGVAARLLWAHYADLRDQKRKVKLKGAKKA